MELLLKPFLKIQSLSQNSKFSLFPYKASHIYYLTTHQSKTESPEKLNLMAQSQASSIFLLLILISIYRVSSTSFTVINQCSYTVWPGLLSGAGTPPLPTTGFSLNPTETRLISIPPSWSGRIWGRTLCTQESSTGKFSCLTGDCGSSTIECSGSGATPPATLAEFTLNGANNLDFYDVSLVDGYNIPMTISPQGGVASNCTITGCVAELNGPCPSQLKVAAVTGEEGGVACKSACEAFGTPEYCCSGAFGTPDKCKPSEYSEFFKNACPRAYSYAYDDGTSTFTCGGADYVITFCPSPTPSVKSATKGLEPEAVSYSTASPNALPTLSSVFSISVLAVASWALQR